MPTKIHTLWPPNKVHYLQVLDEDGIAAPGQIIRNHDVREQAKSQENQ